MPPDHEPIAAPGLGRYLSHPDDMSSLDNQGLPRPLLSSLERSEKNAWLIVLRALELNGFAILQEMSIRKNAQKHQGRFLTERRNCRKD